MVDYDTPDAIWDGIEPCPLHPMGTLADPDCDSCEGESLARSAVIDQISAEAADRMAGIAQQGAPYPHLTFLAIRVEVLIDSCVTDQRSRALFEGEVARRTMTVIKDMQGMLREQQQTPQLLLPNGGEKPRLTVIKNGGPGRS